MKYFLILALCILTSCDFDVINNVDKAVVQDKFYNPPGFQHPESFMLLIKYKDFCFNEYVTANTFGKYDKGDSINIIVHSEYINNKLKGKSFRLIE